MKTKEQQDFNDAMARLQNALAGKHTPTDALAELRKLFGMEDEAGK